MLNRIRVWLRSIVLRRRLEREMQEEMADHLDRSTERLIARGLSPSEAHRAALREFGNVPWLQEQARDARGAVWVDALRADLRFAWRHFSRTPLTTVTMFVVLAVGMSISTLLFTYVYSYATLPPPGVAREADLVRIRGSRDAGAAGRGSRAFAEQEFDAYRELTGPFRAVAGWSDSPVLLDAGADPESRGLEARVTFVTENYFPVLGVRPILGAGLPSQLSDDASAAAVAVVGYRAWEQLFGRDPAVIGSTVAVNGVPVTVVGVVPERFIGMTGFVSLQLWIPLAARELMVPASAPAFRAVGRLRSGHDTRTATAAVQVVATRAAEANGVEQPSAEVVPLLAANGDPMFDRDVRLMTVSIGLLGLLVLLVTCTNVSALLTGLASARRQEIAVRLSLGAARPRLIRQLLTESAVLACAAAAAALANVAGVLHAVSRLLPVLPLDMRINWPVTLFTFGVALAVGIAFGLSPALHATRLAIAGALRDSMATVVATRGRLQRRLVVGQIALTQPLIVLLAAVLLIALTTQPVIRTESGDQVVAVTLRFPAYIGPEQDRTRFDLQLRTAVRAVIDRLEETPGIDAAVMSWGESWLGSYTAGAREGATVQLAAERVDADYFRVMGIPFVRGRAFTSSDVASPAARADIPVVIGAPLARRIWPAVDPIGQRLLPADDSANAGSLIVVGVVSDPQAKSRNARDGYRVFLQADATVPTSALFVRTAGAALPLIGTMRRVIHAESPGMFPTLYTLADREAQNRRRFYIVTGGILAAGVMALLLSAIGLYAVVAFSVSQRTREIAVRMAVGGRIRQIVREFVSDGLRMSVLGLAFGLPVSVLGLYALMLVPDVPTVPLPQVTAIAAFGVLFVAIAAAWIPARRAAAVDPAVTLRSE